MGGVAVNRFVSMVTGTYAIQPTFSIGFPRKYNEKWLDNPSSIIFPAPSPFICRFQETKTNSKNQNRIRARGRHGGGRNGGGRAAGSNQILIFWICFRLLGKRQMIGDGAGNIMLDGLSSHFSLYFLGKLMEN